MGKRERRLVHEVVERVLAKTSPDAAARRFQQHTLNWNQDLADRHDFYSGVIESTLPTLAPENAAGLRRIWEGMTQRMNAKTKEECAAIDAWLEPLTNVEEPPGHRSWFDVLQDCEGGYFSDEEVQAEIRELVKVPGFDEALERLEWPEL